MSHGFRFVIVVGILNVALASPVFAGVTPTPGPEDGIGLTAMLLLGAGVVWLKRKRG